MIDELRVQNLALIKEASLLFSPGITTITGETGSGKTALLSALKLLIGERADTSSIRDTQDELVVEGRVFLPQDPEEELVVRRSIHRTQKARAYINGCMSPVSELGRTIGSTFDLCGQHAHQSLMDPANHVGFIDVYASAVLTPLIEEYQENLTSYRRIAKEIQTLKEASCQSAQRVEQERFVLSRIEQVNPSLEEFELLQKQLPVAEHAQSIALSLSNAHDALMKDEGALDNIDEALSNFQESIAFDTAYKQLYERLESAQIELSDIAHALNAHRRNVVLDEQKLQDMLDRMGEYHGLLRVFGPTLEDALERKKQAVEFLDAIENFDDKLFDLQAQLKDAQVQLERSAHILDNARKTQAQKLVEEIQEILVKLEMKAAKLEFSFTPLNLDEFTLVGPHKVELLVSPGKQMALKPIKRIASGGEISRIMLALKVVLGTKDTRATLVFDEVDAGVGGKTARSLAQVISELGTTHQVIVVTHLPQVAVIGDVQYVVEKTDEENPETRLVPVEDRARIVEIARMLSGTVTESSLQHAEELFDEHNKRA